MWKQGFQSGATECSGNPVRNPGTIHPQPRIQGHPGGSRRRRPHRPLYTESRWAPAAAWAARSELHAHRPLAASALVPATLEIRRRPRRLGPPGIGYRHTAGRWCDTFSCPKPWWLASQCRATRQRRRPSGARSATRYKTYAEQGVTPCLGVCLRSPLGRAEIGQYPPSQMAAKVPGWSRERPTSGLTNRLRET